jgi:hypothetical protein
MPVRKPTLQEWFLAHQLKKLGRDHFYVPFDLDADITRVEAAYKEKGKPTPYTAIVVKALAMAAARRPEINRMYLRTLFGPRVVEFDHISVNMPIILNPDGERHLGAVTVRDAHKLSIADIRAAIREAKTKKPEDMPVGRFVHGKKNTLFNRLRLRAIHFGVYNFPSMLAERSGGLAVSSLISEAGEDCPTRPTAFGPTAFTACMSRVDRSVPGKTILTLGIGIDHSACRGDQAAAGVKALGDILSAKDDADLDALTA